MRRPLFSDRVDGMKRYALMCLCLAISAAAARCQTEGIFADFSTSKGAFTVWLDHSNAPRTLILTLGDEGPEMQAPMDRLVANLRDHALPALDWSFTPRPGESHATIYHGAALDAFRRLFPVPTP